MKKINYYEICNQKLKYLNYSDRTIKSYLHYIQQFLTTIKSLHYRLQKNGYLINFFNYNKERISFTFIVKDEKILKKDER